MKTEQAVSSTWEDLVFENRNKAYGAFTIRKSYSKSISEAALASMLFVALVLLGPRLILFIIGEKTIMPIAAQGEIHELTLGPRIIPIVDPSKPVTSLRKSTRDVIPLVTTASVADPPVTPPTDPPSIGTQSTGGVSSPVQGQTATPGVENLVAPVDPALVDFAEVMPAYEGGLQAMMKFIQKNLKYPRIDRQIGTEGKVFIKFVVNYEGKVVNVEIIRGISESCDKEAARVIAMMPGWKPGMQNKMPVSVRMVLPINFHLEN